MKNRTVVAGKSAQGTASCGCEAEEVATGRKAAGVDPDIKSANLRRLRRIEGQVRGLQGMVEDDRYCADIMIQISSVQEALRAVSRELLRNHLRHCVTRAIRADSADREEVLDELLTLMQRQSR